MFPRLSYIIVVLLLLGSLIILRLVDPAPVKQLRQATFDQLQYFSPRQDATPGQATPSSPVRIISIDQESLDKLGSWPWPRTHIATLVQQLRKQNAAVIGLPLLLENSDPLSPVNVLNKLPLNSLTAQLRDSLQNLPQNDHLLAQAIKKSPVIMGYQPLSAMGRGQSLNSPHHLSLKPNASHKKLAHFTQVRQSLTLLNTPGKGMGALPFTMAAHTQINAMPMLYLNGQDIRPSFTAEMLRIAQGATQYGILRSSTEQTPAGNTPMLGLKIGDLSLPVNAQGQLLLHVKKMDKSRYIPAWKVIKDGANQSDIEGRLVIISSNIPQIAPTVSTALEQNIPRAEILAQSLEQVLQKRFLTRPDYGTLAEATLILLGGLFILFGLFYLGTMPVMLISVLVIGTLTGLGYYLFQSKGLLIDPVFPALSLIILYLAARFMHLIPASQERSTIQTIFAPKLPEHRVKKIVQNSWVPKVDGKYAAVPLLSLHYSGLAQHIHPAQTDPQNFTPLIRQLQSQSKDIIFENGGLMDYHSADSLRAFWDHPCQNQMSPEIAVKDLVLVCQTAQILSAMSTNALKRLSAGQPAQNSPLKAAANTITQNVPTTIILTTGINWIGDSGAARQPNYSLFGQSSADLIQLQAIASTYQAPIIATQIYAEKVGDMPFLPFPVPPQNKPFPQDYIYLLLDQQTAYNPKTFKMLENLHFSLLDAIKAGNIKSANTLIEQCLPLAGSDLKTPYTRLRSYF